MSLVLSEKSDVRHLKWRDSMREGAADMSSTVSDQIFTLAGSMSNRNSTGGEPARGHQAPGREVRPLQQGMPATGRSGVGYVALDALSYDGAQQLLNETDRSGEGRRSYVGAGHAPRSKPTGTPRSRGICASCSVAPTRAILRRSWRRSRSSLAHDRAVPPPDHGSPAERPRLAARRQGQSESHDADVLSILSRLL
jgi:hypothetical protein